MSNKRWTLKDDIFLVRYHELGVDYIADHDLGFHRPGAGVKRMKLLKERGVWGKIEASIKAEVVMQLHHTLEFSSSAVARRIARDGLIEIDQPLPSWVSTRSAA